MTDKFCRDCHWARNKMSVDYLWQCHSPKNVYQDHRISIVTGALEKLYPLCTEARSEYLKDSCQSSGNWFQTTNEVFPSLIKTSTPSIRPSAISLEDL